MAERVPARLTAAEGRKFGLTVGIAFLAFGSIAMWRGKQRTSMVLLSLGGVLVVAALIVPTLLGPVEKASRWSLAHAISEKVTTPIFMGVVYFLVITPIGFIRGLSAGKMGAPKNSSESNGRHTLPRWPSPREHGTSILEPRSTYVAQAQGGLLGELWASGKGSVQQSLASAHPDCVVERRRVARFRAGIGTGAVHSIRSSRRSSRNSLLLLGGTTLFSSASWKNCQERTSVRRWQFFHEAPRSPPLPAAHENDGHRAALDDASRGDEVHLSSHAAPTTPSPQIKERPRERDSRRGRGH